MTSHADRCARFLELHHGATPLLLPNAWDVGTAKIFAALGFDALATTSGGHAATLGRRDGSVTRDEALEHDAAIVGATDLPVNADFENGFADKPTDVAANVALVVETGVAGCSIEDFANGSSDPIYDIGLAAERVQAAAEAAHRGSARLVLTARAENYLHGRPDLADTIARLQAYQAAGADALYAPAVTNAGDLRSIVASVDLPLNVLALPGVPTVAELGAIGVKRVSVGSAFSLVALGAVIDAAKELREQGTYDYFNVVGSTRGVVAAAFSS